MSELKEMIHKECGGVAYLYTNKVYKQNDPIMSKDFFHLDGTPTEPNEEIRCGSCGRAILIGMSSDGSLYADDWMNYE